jgi:RNA polymerase sigma-70 factor (ECF subfamily)
MRECIARYGAVVWALARRHSPTGQEAEDAVQEIFLDLWRSAARFDSAVASETVFVAMIARRRLIDRGRARKRRPATEHISDPQIEAGGEGTPDAETCAEASLAAAAVAELRPEQREVLLLAIRHGLSHEEISTTMNLPLGTVKAHARRGLIHVREWLADPKSRKKGGAT